MSSVPNEPKPLWPEAPRFCPQRNFPRYRFTPGLNPHPTAHPQGHSYGHDLDAEATDPLTNDQWSINSLYLYGIDLYHQGYFWESHEAWEALWHLSDKEGPDGQFLQGLIQNAAALLKVHLQQWNAARHLSHESWERLVRVFRMIEGSTSPDPHYMGIHLKDLLEQMQTYYTSLWKNQEEITGSAPRLSPLSFSSFNR